MNNMPIALWPFVVVIAVLSLCVLLLIVRMVFHFEKTLSLFDRIRQEPAAQLKQFADLMETSRHDSAVQYQQFSQTLERLLEKYIGDVGMARQHSAERAVAAEAQRPPMMQPMNIPAMPEDDPGPEQIYSLNGQ